MVNCVPVFPGCSTTGCLKSFLPWVTAEWRNSLIDACKQRMLRPVSEVADTDTWLGAAGRYVDAVLWHSRRHYVVYIRDMVRAGPVIFVETVVETR